ncbi:hypothetical protein M408DRAFT_332964 [Serendipita vermifera MAFF 305830]|uniref:Uncharacterized protein n=1 Tax=Serendipita vermifera MAFF 305830 TaxID=933852 RepID=A0A0C3ACD8_SERVB|nr:hypothetical protein M408DRAFT_332964 [Serendipita vermifera MAFF 305830]
MDTLPIMLCRSRTAQRISLKSLIDGTDDECTKQLEEMLDAVESSAYQFISFLRRFLDEYQKRNMWAEDIAIILECIDTALNLPHEVYLPPVLRLLTNELKDISKRFVTDGCGLLEERELVFKQALKVIHRIDIVS